MQKFLLLHSDIVTTPCPSCGTDVEAIVERSNFVPEEYYSVDFRWNCECSVESKLKWEDSDKVVSTLTDLGRENLLSKEEDKGVGFLLALHGYLWWRKHPHKRFCEVRYALKEKLRERTRKKAEKRMEKLRAEWSRRWGGRE